MKKEDTVKILDRVLDFSKSKGLFDCGIIVVGLSGGPDSVALLHILKGLRNCFDIECDIYALHCNHHLRPGVCDEEAGLVKELCRENYVELKVLDFDCRNFAQQNHISEETAGRVLRYEAFEQYARSLEESTGKTVRIAIAHHKDDIAETMMMNLFRGSGLEGLVNPKALTGRIIRPLLCLKKCELVDYLDTLGVGYAIDQTNLSTDGTRNTWRNDFLPKIGEFYHEDPAVPLARTYKLLCDDLDFINSMTGKAYASVRLDLSGHPFLSVPETVKLHPSMKSRVIRMLWYETFGDLIDFEELHLNDCCGLMEREARGEMILDMPFGRKAYRHEDVFAFSEGGRIVETACAAADRKGYLTSPEAVNVKISLADLAENCQIDVQIPNSAYILKVRIIENEAELEYNNLLWFCPVNAIDGGEITFGNCKGSGTGFRIKKAGSSGSKELSRLMTDLKIPESARKQVLFFHKDGEVMWLPGFGHSVGFTNALSREKFIAGRQSGSDDSDALLKIVIERQ